MVCDSVGILLNQIYGCINIIHQMYWNIMGSFDLKYIINIHDNMRIFLIYLASSVLIRSLKTLVYYGDLKLSPSHLFSSGDMHYQL